jgi:hypothetical protein
MNLNVVAFILTISNLLINSFNVIASDDKDTLKPANSMMKKNTIHLDGGGAAIALIYDRIILKKKNFAIYGNSGLGMIPGEYCWDPTFPASLGVLFGKRRYYLDINVQGVLLGYCYFKGAQYFESCLCWN